MSTFCPDIDIKEEPLGDCEVFDIDNQFHESITIEENLKLYFENRLTLENDLVQIPSIGTENKINFELPSQWNDIHLIGDLSAKESRKPMNRRSNRKTPIVSYKEVITHDHTTETNKTPKQKMSKIVSPGSTTVQPYHHSLTYNSEKLFECIFCDHKCRQLINLKVHLRIHKGEKPYQCTYCESRFRQLGSLQNHTRIHTGEKPFKCEECDSQFRQQGNLQNHMRTHTGEKPFECSYCNSRFRQRGTLQSHMRRHTGKTPFECIYCHSKFNNKRSVKCHTLTHTGEKQFL